ncbi:putative M1 family peptidase [Monocercomonoides exilis]|uniref:putative M1 family peptidase n=1 Tax=Monocercomonoides exilis TaxID=2049356 RepID=UPI0035599270|nr:putative M1 family peptidase [Monocercomonoides exilis]|eukprot:MONOS_14108.1-p1 / transcript=MONOS_14108.1 / gene=MONOS_14108 / organism=Monocercomonoides_exilis_PA203 / gene_product=TPA / transcript_product=TPA / location=Mono_scaffold00940:1067-4561(-) / protein_length=1164 / sequence_SO=supercontig / SO=protein_coding / is_pseudo=false
MDFASINVISLNEVIPIHYSLTLNFDSLCDNSPNPDLVKGSVFYSFKVISPVKSIQVNASAITIKEVTPIDMLASFDYHSYSINEKNETVTFEFEKALEPCPEYIIKIDFEFSYAKDLYGAYVSYYLDSEGRKKKCVATQLEASFARRVFPCVDQPFAKATFDIKLVHPKGTTAISNMPVASVSGANSDCSLIQTEFMTTPKMSTYLIAIAIGEFDSIGGSCCGGKLPLTIYTTPGKAENGKFALKIAQEVIDFLSEYTRVPIPLPKMDFLCVPEFSPGAMENWGFIIFRETCLLVSDDSSPSILKQVATFIAHELAHQWAGDLVTPVWWDEIWLNEGFATLLANFVLGELHPDWRFSEEFQSNGTKYAFEVDMQETTHPIHVAVKNAIDVEDCFDRISYEKSSSVLRMLMSFIGREGFRKGFSNYLMEHAYSCTMSKDLFFALGDAAQQIEKENEKSSENKGNEAKEQEVKIEEQNKGKVVVEMMNSWTEQSGFPLVCVKLIEGKLGASSQTGKYSLMVNQRRFVTQNLEQMVASIKSGKDPEPIESDLPDATLWHIPLTMKVKWSTSESATVVSTVMNKRATTVQLTPPVPTAVLEWVKVNEDHAGFYIVYYEQQDMLDALLHQIRCGKNIREVKGRNEEILSGSDRLGIISDLYFLTVRSFGQLIPLPEYFSFAQKILSASEARKCGETSYYVWKFILDSLSDSGGMFVEGAVDIWGARKWKLGEDELADIEKECVSSSSSLTVQNDKTEKESYDPVLCGKNFKEWILSIILPKAESLGLLDLKQEKERNEKENNEKSKDFNTLQLSSHLMPLLVTYGHEQTISFMQNLFDSTFLHLLHPIYVEIFEELKREGAVHKQVELGENVNLELLKGGMNSVGIKKEGKEADEIILKERREMDEKLGAAYISILPEFRECCLMSVVSPNACNSACSKETVNVREKSNEMLSHSLSLSEQRRAILLALYHCSSALMVASEKKYVFNAFLLFDGPIQLPVESASSSSSSSSSSVQPSDSVKSREADHFNISMAFVINPCTDIGVYQQEIHHVPFVLSLLFSTGTVQRLWMYFARHNGKYGWKLAASRIGANLRRFLLDHMCKRMILCGKNERDRQIVNKITRDFIKVLKEYLDESGVMQDKEKVESNTKFWDLHHKDVLEWISHCIQE